MADDPVDLLRDTLRARPRGHAWRPLYEAAITEAYRRGDLDTLARLAGLASGYLAAEGRTDEALEEMRFAIRLSTDDARTNASLIRIRSSHELLGAHPSDALASLSEARSIAGESATPADQIDLAMRESIARCVALSDASPDDLIDSHTRAQRAGISWLATGGLTWLIPWMLATGRRREALPWVETAVVASGDIGNRWRVEEVEVCRLGVAVTSALVDVERPDPSWEPDHSYIAAWQRSSLSAYVHHARGAARELREVVSGRSAIEQVVPAGFRSTAAGLEVVCVVLEGGEAPDVAPPDEVSLINLAGALMAAEAAAESGTQSSAAAWMRWVDARLPAHVRTSMEWPVAVDRIRALLSARAGSSRSAVGLMRSALSWAQTHGYAVEEAIASIQLSELLALAPALAARGEWRELRDGGRARCAELGIDVAAVADQARSAAALGRFDFERPQLTPREAEVLALLAEGQTYRGTAESLGIDWRTVQTHAHHAYQKLGVSGKIAAISAARELGLI